MASLGVCLVLLPLAGAGCFLRPQTVVARFHGEFVCPEEQIKVQRLQQENMFRAEGCNRRANYRCSGEYGEFCERIGQPETINHEATETMQLPSSGMPKSAQ